MNENDARARWFILQSADAVGTRTRTTEEILELYDRGALDDRTVIHHRFESRRDTLTVGDLVARVRAKK